MLYLGHILDSSRVQLSLISTS